MHAKQHGFTLIEIALVIGIVAVFAVVTIMVFQPSVILAQVRDSRRMVDMDTLSKIFYARGTEAITGFGTLNTVYTSLPDTSSTCANLNLPGLPGGFTYNCVTTTTLTNVDGTGWLPINMNTLSTGAPISVLPVDPRNSAQQNLYYTYTCTTSGCEFATVFESQKRLATLTGTDALLGIYSKGKTGITPGRRDMSLVGWWKLDDGSGTVALDSSDFGYNGTLVNTPTWTTGPDNGALSFDPGSSEYVTVADQPPLKPSHLTVAAWLNPTTIDTTYESAVAKTSSGGWGDGWGLLSWTNGEGKIRFYINDWTGAVVSSTLPTSTWSHVVGTYDRTNIKLYVNGVLVDTFPYTTAIDHSDSVLRIGDAHNYFWNGSIDDVRIYNRALTGTEVDALYDSY